jgi:uncharacterized membrane protein
VTTTFKRVVDESFIVRAPLDFVWNHVARVEEWPSWAKHIRSISISPSGSLSLQTNATLRLSNGVKTSFEMIEFDPPHHWKWAGSFLGAQILYNHIFARKEHGETLVRFTVDVSGGIGVLVRGIFGSIYRRNLSRAVPLLIAEIEAAARSKQ